MQIQYFELLNINEFNLLQDLHNCVDTQTRINRLNIYWIKLELYGSHIHLLANVVSLQSRCNVKCSRNSVPRAGIHYALIFFVRVRLALGFIAGVGEILPMQPVHFICLSRVGVFYYRIRTLFHWLCNENITDTYWSVLFVPLPLCHLLHWFCMSLI